MTRSKTITALGGLFIGCGSFLLLGAGCLLGLGVFWERPNQGAPLSPAQRLVDGLTNGLTIGLVLSNFLVPVCASAMILAGLALVRRLPGSRRLVAGLAWAGLLYVLLNGLAWLWYSANLFHPRTGEAHLAGGPVSSYTLPLAAWGVVPTALQAAFILAVILALRSRRVRQALAAVSYLRAVQASLARSADRVSQPAPLPPQEDEPFIRSTSPNGRFRLQVTAWEAFNTLWVYNPEIIDLAAGASLFRFQDQHWSLDLDEWEAGSIVRLSLRKYPGNHRPPVLEVHIDCAAHSAWVASSPPVALEQLEAELDRHLTWIR